MTPLDSAIHDITALLDSLTIDYAVVGGIANAIWGEPRATIDVDVTISVPEPDLARTVTALSARLRPSVPDAVTFVERTRVLPLDTADGVRIDVIFALVPFELEAIRRAREVSIAGRAVRVVTAEDLVLMKIISERPRDVADAEAIVRRRVRELDLGYLEPRVRELATALEWDEVLVRWRKWTGG